MKLDAQAAQHAKHALSADDFYGSANARLFTLLTSSMPHGEVEVDLVMQGLTKDPEVWDVFCNPHAGYTGYMSSERLESACAELRKMSVVRRVLAASLAIQGSPTSDPDAFVDDAVARITEAVRDREVGAEGYSLSNLMEEIAYEIAEPPPDPPFIPSRVEALNQLLNGGFEQGSQYVIAGRPGTGKTSFGLDCMVHAATLGKYGAIYTLEMTAKKLGQRLISARAQLDSRIVSRPGTMSDKQRETAIGAAMQLRKYDMRIVPASGWGIDQIVRHAKREHMKRPLEIVCVDYAGIVKTPKERSRTEEVGNVSAGFHDLLIKLNCPGLLLAQLSRDIEKRTNQRPVLSDLRESGSLEQDADCVIFTWHDEKNGSELVVGKNRNGETGSVRVKFEKQYTRFVDI